MWNRAISGALTVVVVAGIAALVLFVVRMLEAWRALQETRSAVFGALDGFAARAETVVDKVAVAGNTAEPTGRLGRPRLSLARLAVLRVAIDEADDTFCRVAIVPHE